MPIPDTDRAKKKERSLGVLVLNDFLTPCHMCFSFEYWLAYLHVDTGLGSTTPAVYTAWNIPSMLTLRVISLISTGATRFERSFLWTHRKLISTILFNLEQQKERRWLVHHSKNASIALLQMYTISYECSRVIDAYICRDGTDEANKLLIWGNSHSTMPLWQPARWTQSPERRRRTVEQCMYIFGEQLIKHQQSNTQEQKSELKAYHLRKFGE